MILAFSVLSCGCVLRADLVLQQLYKAGTSTPLLNITQGADGNFYGIASQYVAPAAGSIFKLTAAGAYTTIYSFQNGGPTGSNPEGALVLANDGKLYGAAATGGFYDAGTIFRITTPGGLTLVAAFDGTNGAVPLGLSCGIDGYLYGVTAASTGRGPGTVFRLSTNGILTKLYSFSQQYVGQYGDPNSAPTQGRDGGLYGTTTSGVSGQSSIYRLSTNGAFAAIAIITNNSVRLTGGLVQGQDDCFYGTTVHGTTAGTVFRMTTNGELTTLVSFNATNGSRPEARLLLATDGYFYGTTASGGISNRGTIFRLTTNGDLTTIVHFTGTNGNTPESALIEGRDRNLYGTTISSGSSPSGGGTVFRLVEKPVLVSSTFSNQTATLTWTSFTNGIYRVEHKASLADNGWIAKVPNVTATNSLTTISDQIGDATQRWYRVVLLP